MILAGSETRVTDLPAFPLPGHGVEPVAVRAPRVLACLDQRHRGDLAEPFPFGRGLREGDDPALHLGVTDLFSPARYAASLVRRASLNTTLEHPNVRASIRCWPGVGYAR